MDQRKINRRGMAAMAAGVAAFAVNDAIMKHLVTVLPLSEIMVFRGIIAGALAIVPLMQARQLALLPHMLHKSVLLRASLEAIVVLVYMQALRHIPLGLATGILQATPLLITAFAAIVGRESVGPARWLAVLVGLAGVLMIVQPDASGIEPAMAIAVLTAVLVACRDLSNRLVPRFLPVFLIVFAASIANTLAGALLAAAPGGAWHMPTSLEWLLMAGAAISVLSASAFITFAFRGTEVSAISPFRYAGVPVAVFFGYLVWGDLPNLLASIEIILVVAAGIFAMQDEARRAKLPDVPNLPKV